MTKKPYYKRVIGGKAKSMTSADLRFDCGRIRIEVNDAYPHAAAVLSKLFDRHWRVVLNNAHAFIEAHPFDCVLTEPADRPLATEVANMNAVYERRAKREVDRSAPNIGGQRETASPEPTGKPALHDHAFVATDWPD